MIKRFFILGAAVVALAALGTSIALAGSGNGGANGRGLPKPDRNPPPFSDPTTIDNKYAPLTKFRSCELAGEDEDGAKLRVVRTLLDRTKRFEVEGEKVDVAVFKDKEFEDGELVERTFDYFGQADNGGVYYFGEDVRNFENGKPAGSGGSFLYGKDTNVLGLLMPGNPEVGDDWFFEYVPGTTIEYDRLVKRFDSKTVKGTTYQDVIRVRELARPGNEVEFKLYASGIGNIAERPPDAKLDLVSCS